MIELYCLLCKRTIGETNGSGSGRGFEVHHDQCQAQRQRLVLSKLSVCKYIRIITNHAMTTEIQICIKCLGKRPNSRCKPGIAEAKYTYSSVDFRWPFKHVRKAAEEGKLLAPYRLQSSKPGARKNMQRGKHTGMLIHVY